MQAARIKYDAKGLTHGARVGIYGPRYERRMCGVISDLGGTKSIIICFHGHNKDGSAATWGQPGENGDFVRDLRKAGFSYICPPSQSGKWSSIPGASNPDIINVQNIVKNLLPRSWGKTPFFFVGHSNGGGFVSRMVAHSEIRPAAVQYSNASGIDFILRSSTYKTPSLFCFSQHDPIVDYARVRASIQILVDRQVPAIAQDLTLKYDARHFGNHHQFMNTSGITEIQFNRFASIK